MTTMLPQNTMLHPAFWQDRRVLVTGATGLLGSHMVVALHQYGADVVCLIRDQVSQSLLIKEGWLGQITAVHGDICNQELLERVLGEYEIDTVFHLAAQTIVGVANRNPISTFESNIAGTWRLLEACRRSPKVSQIVVASSDKAYGEHEVLPYDEKAPLQGRHPYDVSKSCADLITQTYANTYGLNVCITRCGNLYGGGDLNWNRVIPGTIRSILRNESPIIRSDGQFIRDYFYVADAVAAYMMLSERMAETDTLKGEAFNFSNELQISVTDLVNQILDVMGSELSPTILNQASHEIRNQYLSAEKARRMLQWHPLYDLPTGLTQTVAWYQKALSSCNPQQTLMHSASV